MEANTNPLETKPTEVKKEVTRKKPILKNTEGKEMKEEEYFFKATEKGGKAPDWFNKVCGQPVDREDLISIFNKTFDPKYNFLFYKTTNKEVYIIIIPIKYAVTIGGFNDSIDGDFQKHAISFVGEGSVNIESLKTKLKRINGFVKLSD